MHPRLALFAIRLTATLVLASLWLILAGMAGFGAALPLAAVFTVLTVLLYAGRQSLSELGRVAGLDVGDIARIAWVGALIPAVLVAGSLGASPAELSAIGGLLGLAGMVNYFLRPVYGLVYAAGRYVDRAFAGRDHR